MRALTWTASVALLSRRWNTRSTPSSSTIEVEMFTSPRVLRMQAAATRYSIALPIRPALALLSRLAS